MLHRGYLRRGVSLEVIVEEDDNAEVSFDHSVLEDEESDCTRSSGSSSSSASAEDAKAKKQRRDRSGSGSGKGGGAPRNNFERLREEKETRKRHRDGEEERRKRLGRQRSLSCETLTILDVGDDELSREQWEEEAREWDGTAGSTGESQIRHSISRRKILASRTVDQNGIEPQNEETPVDDPELDINQEFDPEKEAVNGFEEAEMKGGENWNPMAEDQIEKDLEEKAENQEDLAISEEQEEDRQTPSPINKDSDALNSDLTQNDNSHYSATEPSSISKFDDFGGNDLLGHTIGSPTFPNHSPDMWLRDTFNDGEDSWITVGELENGIDDHDMPKETNEETDKERETSTEIDTAKDGSKAKMKEVRFSDELEYVSDEITEKGVNDHHHQHNVDKTVKTTEFRATSPAQLTESEQRLQSPVPEHVSDSLPSASEQNEPKEHQKNSGKYCPTCELPEHPSTPHQDHLVSVEEGRTLFEGTQKVFRRSFQLHSNPGIALENRDIIIFERNPTSTVEESESSMEYHEGRVNGMPYNVHNTELHPEELPPPHTVSSVRQLFENVPTFMHTIDHFSLPSRFDHVRSNPSSKILRFDRDRHDPKGSLAPNGNTKRNVRNLPANHAQNITGLREGRSYFPPKKLGLLCHRAPEDYCSTGVHLRKPRLARGFDVKKALQENPRYFHIRVSNKDKGWDQPNGNQISNKSLMNRRNTITYSYVEAKHQNYRGSTTTLRWTKETIDRSDAESLSSDSSEDSGVSRDFSSSIISAFTSSSKKNSRRTSATPMGCHEYNSDPSFKWIDPTVLSKIRALGTTVIYFGPRHRPHNRSASRSEEPMRTTYKDDIIFRVNRGGDSMKRERTHNGSVENPSINSTENGTADNVEEGCPSPRIVGVTAKYGVNDCGGSWDNTPENTFSRGLRKLCKREVTRVNSTGQNSIVYDFT